MAAEKFFTHDGMTMNISEWERHLKLSYGVLRARIYRGMSFADAIAHKFNTTRNGTKRGDGCTRPDGYRILHINGKAILEHKFLAEKAIGRKLKEYEEVHHVNNIRSDNSPSNLVICPNQDYHKLLHIRTEALEKSGNANYRKCTICQKFDDPELMYAHKTNGAHYHRACRNSYQKKWRKQCQSAI